VAARTLAQEECRQIVIDIVELQNHLADGCSGPSAARLPFSRRAAWFMG
jgi:hypothetical protein